MKTDVYAKHQRQAEWTVILCFLAALVLPSVPLLWSHGLEGSSLPMPKDETSPAPIAAYERFNESFSSNYYGRMLLVRAYLNIMANWLGDSPHSQTASGSCGWLFYTGSNEVLCCKHVQFTHDELAKWVGQIRANGVCCRRLGIHYIFVVAPDKHTIYPEYLPKNLSAPSTKSRLDQLMDALKTEPGLEVVDLRPVLARAKKSQQVYYKTDSHWNPAGAFAAYQAIQSRVSCWYPNATPVPFREYRLSDVNFSGDLASLMGIDLRESATLYREKTTRASFIRSGNADFRCTRIIIDVLRSKNYTAPIHKMVMFRDSFGTDLIPHFAQHFQNALYLWKDFNPQDVGREKPDVVIQEVVERRLMNDPS